jgi:hypothetical protein
MANLILERLDDVYRVPNTEGVKITALRSLAKALWRPAMRSTARGKRAVIASRRGGRRCGPPG